MNHILSLVFSTQFKTDEHRSRHLPVHSHNKSGSGLDMRNSDGKWFPLENKCSQKAKSNHRGAIRESWYLSLRKNQQGQKSRIPYTCFSKTRTKSHVKGPRTKSSPCLPLYTVQDNTLPEILFHKMIYVYQNFKKNNSKLSFNSIHFLTVNCSVFQYCRDTH